MFRFFRIALVSYKSLFGWLSPKVYFTTKILNPTFQLIFYTLLAGYAHQAQDVTPYVIGNSILLCYRNAMFGVGNNLALERRLGTLKLSIMAPLNKFIIFVGQGFMHIVDGVFNILICLLVGTLLFNLDLSNLNMLLFFLTLCITVFATIGLGLLIGCFGLVITDMNLIMNLVGMSLIMLSGANFAITRFPVWIQKICYSIPLTRGIEATRAIVKGATLIDVRGLLIEEFLLGCVYIGLGVLILKVMEQIARKQASLEIF